MVVLGEPPPLTVLLVTEIDALPGLKPAQAAFIVPVPTAAVLGFAVNVTAEPVVGLNVPSIVGLTDQVGAIPVTVKICVAPVLMDTEAGEIVIVPRFGDELETETFALAFIFEYVA